MIKRELIIFTIVTIIVFIIVISLIIFSNDTPFPSPLPSPSVSAKPSQPTTTNNLPSIQPFPSPLIFPSPSPIIVTTKEDLTYQLPFQGNSFNIEYLSVSDLFAVTIKENPYKENVTKAEEWFKDRGFNPEELNIYYHVFPGVQR